MSSMAICIEVFYFRGSFETKCTLEVKMEGVAEITDCWRWKGLRGGAIQSIFK